MAQRELKVKVTANIDKSLTKLLDSLKKTKNLKVKVDVKKGDLTSVTKTLDRLSKKTISPKVSVKTNDKGLSNLQKDLNRLGNQKVTASVNVKTNNAGLDGLQRDMDAIGRKADEVGSARISPIGVASGLAPLAVTLDQLSDKILQIGQQTIAPVFTEALDASKELYDQQVSFVKSFRLQGESDDTIGDWMSDISKYAQSTIFDTQELLSLFSTFQASGVDDSMGLTKALAGISSMAPNTETALKRVGYQFKQMSKDGKVYSRDWNAIREALGGVASNKVNEWFKKNKGFALNTESFSEGKVMVEDFMNAVREVGGSDMFQKMARSTDTLSGSLAQFKETLRNTLIGDQYDPGPLRSIFDGFVSGLNEVTDQIPSLAQDLGKGLDFLKKEFGNAFKDFSVKDFFDGLKSSFQSAVPVIKVVAKALALLTNNGKDTGKVIGNLVKFAVGWKMFRGLAQPVLSLASAGGTLYKVASKLGGLNFGSSGILGKMFGGGSSGGGSRSSKAPSIKNIKAQALNTAKNLATLAGVLATVWASAKAMESISNMDISWNGLLNNLSATAVGLTLAGGYIAVIGVAMRKIKGAKKTLLQGATAVTGISGTLLAVTEFVSIVSNIKIKSNNLLKNLGVLATTLTATGAYMLAIGAALKFIPGAKEMILIGAVALAGIALALVAITAEMDLVVKNMVRTANRMGDIKVSAMDIIKGVGKLTELSLALGAMSTITIAPNIISAIGGFFGGLANMAQNWNIDEGTKVLDKISKLEIPDSKNLKKAISFMTELGNFNAGTIIPNLKNGLTGFSSGFSAIANWAQDFNITKAIDAIEKINKAKIPKPKDIKDKFDDLAELMSMLANMNGNANGFQALGDAGKNLADGLDSWAKGLNIDQITKVLKKVTTFAKEISALELGDVESTQIKDKIGRIGDFITGLQAAVGQFDSDNIFAKQNKALGSGIDTVDSWFGGKNVDNIISQIKKVVDFANKLNAIDFVGDSKTVDSIKEKFDSIRDFANKIKEVAGQSDSDSNLDKAGDAGGNAIDTGGSWLGGINIDNIIKQIDDVMTIANKLKSVSFDGDVADTIKDNLDRIKEFADKIKSTIAGQTEGQNLFEKGVGSLVNGTDATGSLFGAYNVDNIAKQIDDVMRIATKLKALRIDEGIATQIDEKLKALKTVMDSIQNFSNGIQSATSNQAVSVMAGGLTGKIFGNLFGGAENKAQAMSLDGMVEMVESIVHIARSLTKLPQIDGEAIKDKVDSIKKAVETVRDMTVNENESSSGGQAEGDAIKFSTILNRVNTLIEITNALNSIPAVAEGLTEKITAIDNAITALLSIGAGEGEGGEGVAGKGVSALTSMLQQVNSTLAQLQALRGQFQATGTSYAQSLVNGFNGGGVDRIVSKMQSIISRLNGMSNLSHIGSRMSSTLASGFNANSLIGQINRIQSAINSLKGKTVTININEVTTKSTVRRANGGIIPEYHSTGGRVGSNLFKKRGTDTVPTMLTPGEYVLKRSVSNALGKGFLDALNGLNLSSAMAQLQNKVGGNITNNTYNNITQNVDNKASYLNGLGSIRRVVRS